ncbi:MAG TPA: GNAT family N-acetyltransferase [Nocardioidaceae bacterium]|nr:GNAT family N-acetyltransferase [Nocardioidaceae bacterium]
MTGPSRASPGVRSARLDQLSATELHGLLRLRIDVFVVEQHCPYPELDGRDTDPDTLHLWTADDSGSPTAYLRVLAEADGSVRIGRVCTRADRRGGGLAAQLMGHVLQQNEEHRVVLDAQSHLRGWYERFGFTASGPEFIEDGIPHTPMARGQSPSR